MRLSLTSIAIHTVQLNAIKAFYERFGLYFTQQQHGDSPVHYCAILLNNAMFEIFPGNERQEQITIGFTADVKDQVTTFIVRHFGTTSYERIERDGMTVYIFHDPDGRRVELSQAI